MLTKDGQLYPAFGLCLILSLFTFPYCLARGHGGGGHHSGGEHRSGGGDHRGREAGGGGHRASEADRAGRGAGLADPSRNNRRAGPRAREDELRSNFPWEKDRVDSWGSNGHFRERGRWAGWARPWHRYWNVGGYWGGWPVYGSFYAGYPGYFNLDVNNGQAVDAEGRVYSARRYDYCGSNVASYNWPGNDDETPAGVGAHVVPGVPSSDSDYRLGPDTDVLADGSIVLHLTDEAYLRVKPEALEVVEQGSGRVLMKLFPDENLFIQLSSELERQSLGLKAHLAGRLDLRSGSLEFKGKKLIEDGRLARESDNLRYAIALLEKARAKLGDVSGLVAYDKPPLPDFEGKIQAATEVFASVYMLDDGSRLALRQPDGHFLYLDSKAVYTQPRGDVSRLSFSYPSHFMSVVGTYLTSLVGDSGSNLAVLEAEKKRYGARLALLQDYLRTIQSASSASCSAVSSSSSSSSGKLSVSSPLADNEDGFTSNDPQIREGEKERYEFLIARLNRRLEALERQTEASGVEVQLAQLALANLGLQGR